MYNGRHEGTRRACCCTLICLIIWWRKSATGLTVLREVSQRARFWIGTDDSAQQKKFNVTRAKYIRCGN